MKLFKKIITYTASIVTGVLFISTLVLIVIGIKANKDNTIVSLFGYSYSVVATDSMEPTIKVGDIIISKSIPYIRVKEGDIIVFYSEAKSVYFVHKVILVRENGDLVTKGDNPKAPEDVEPVTIDNYFGVVTTHGKFLNIGTLILKYRNIVYILIMIIFSYIIVTETISIVKKVNKHNQEELEVKAKLEIQAIKDEIKMQITDEQKNKEIL